MYFTLAAVTSASVEDIILPLNSTRWSLEVTLKSVTNTLPSSRCTSCRVAQSSKVVIIDNDSSPFSKSCVRVHQCVLHIPWSLCTCSVSHT